MTLPVPLDRFYSDEPLRAFSRERDFGIRWRDADGGVYRAAWIEATRELYLFRSGPDPQVEVLAADVSEEEVEAALAGWALAGNDLAWLLSATLPLAAGRPEAA